MGPMEIKAFMETHGYPLGFSLSPFGFLRYPPATGARHNMNPAKIKENMIQNDTMFSGKLHNFREMYLEHAAKLLDMSSNAFLPGHPMKTMISSSLSTKEENDKLRKENTELRKRIEQMKSKK